MFEVKQENYTGPLDKLLTLIEERQIEITRLNLAQVTGDFIAYVQKLEQEKGIEPAVLADFVVVAAKMLLIKSKVLLPSLELTQEEEEEIMDLEERLKLYREFSARGGSALGGENASAHLRALWDKNQPMHSREFLASLGGTRFFYPPAKISASDMIASLESLFNLLKDLIPETRTVKNKVITLQQKIAELTKRLQQATQLIVKGLAKKSERQEVIVLFLAVLHMLANRLAEVEQSQHFGDMIVRRMN